MKIILITVILLLFSFVGVSQNVQQSSAKKGGVVSTSESSEINVAQDPKAVKMTSERSVSVQTIEEQPIESNEQEAENGIVISNKRKIE